MNIYDINIGYSNIKTIEVVANDEASAIEQVKNGRGRIVRLTKTKYQPPEDWEVYLYDSCQEKVVYA